MKYFLLFLLFFVSVTGCNQGNERIEEKASIEGKVGSAAAVQAENANREARVAAMESDLERRRRFIDSVVGTYEGTTTNRVGKEDPIRLIIASSFPRMPKSSQARSPEELSTELTNLHLNVHVIEWSAEDEPSEIAFGCVFEHVRPDIVEGTIYLMSKECSMSYVLFAAGLGAESKVTNKLLASYVVDGKLSEVPAFTGLKQSSISSKRLPLQIRKVSNTY